MIPKSLEDVHLCIGIKRLTSQQDPSLAEELGSTLPVHQVEGYLEQTMNDDDNDGDAGILSSTAKLLDEGGEDGHSCHSDDSDNAYTPVASPSKAT